MYRAGYGVPTIAKVFESNTATIYRLIWRNKVQKGERIQKDLPPAEKDPNAPKYSYLIEEPVNEGKMYSEYTKDKWLPQKKSPE